MNATRNRRFVRRKVVLIPKRHGRGADAARLTVTSTETPVNDPFLEAVGAFADDANWEEFMALIERQRQDDNALEQ